MNSSKWSTAQIPDLSGRTAVVTGANSGLGYETTKALAAHGAHVVMACRSLDRASDARLSIEQTDPAGSLSTMDLDLADLSSVRSFAETFDQERSQLHILCNNAGVQTIPRSETADGFETHFGVNHLGHFALTGLMLDHLRETAGETRIVTQSSMEHDRGEIDFSDLHGDASYDKWDAYRQSKLANLLFAIELDRRLRAANATVRSVATHPGFAATNFYRGGPDKDPSWLRIWGWKLFTMIQAQSAKAGALPMLYAATAPDVDGGAYIGPGGFRNMRGPPVKQRPDERASDEETARRLWGISEELTGVTFGLPDAR